ncbi:hypothetical protein CLOP_g24943 [Closterium sp. NIES-67]|nr:hypothetical protein CLOP_g24943 [Closterium sp. NIES-67]
MDDEEPDRLGGRTSSLTHKVTSTASAAAAAAAAAARGATQSLSAGEGRFSKRAGTVGSGRSAEASDATSSMRRTATGSALASKIAQPQQAAKNLVKVFAKAKGGVGKRIARAQTAVRARTGIGRRGGAQDGDGGEDEDEEEEDDDDDESEAEDSDAEGGVGSSDDEEKPKEGPPKAGKFLRSLPSRRMSIYNADGFMMDDEDASEWNMVNEDVLVRKVRELRELRGDFASATNAPATKSALEGLGLSELNDPLGYGPLNRVKVCLAINASTIPVPDDRSMAEKVIVFGPKFSSPFYLGRVHDDTSIEELRAGMATLGADMENQQQQLKTLVKENFDSFVSCKSTIEDIQKKVREMESRSDSGTEEILVATRNVHEMAQAAFGPLLERQKQVDRIRSVQGLLLRFRTLFNLPAVMRAFVQHGEYDRAVHEYLKAKSISLPAHSNILRRVMAEVHKVVAEFHEVLYSKMDDPNADQAQVENAIRLLLELEPDSDPIWHHVTMQDRRIRGLLEACVQQHESRIATLKKEQHEKREAEARWRQIQQESNEGEDVDLSLLLGQPVADDSSDGLMDGEAFDEAHTRLILRLTAILKLHVPRFWRLTRSIFSGKFASFATSKDGTGTGQARSQGGWRGRGGEEGTRYTKHSEDEVLLMVLGMMGVYETKVQAAFTQLEGASTLRPHMRRAVEEVAAACAALAVGDNAPPQAVQALHQLRVEITSRFVSRVCLLTRGIAAELVADEDWRPVPSALRMGSPFAISSFPLRLRDRLANAFEHVTAVLNDMADEEELIPPNARQLPGFPTADEVEEAIRLMYESVKKTFADAFQDACDALTKLSQTAITTTAPDAAAASGNTEGAGEGGKQEGGEGAAAPAAPAAAVPSANPDDIPAEPYVGLKVGEELTTADQRLLMLLSNCGFCRSVLAPYLADKFTSLWLNPYSVELEMVSATAYRQVQPQHQQQQQLAELRAVLGEVERAFVELEAWLGDQYIAIKANHLGFAVIKYFLEDGTSWATAPPVRGLRDSALELMHPLVAVHAEVHVGCRPFVDKAINTLAEGLMDALQQVAYQHEDLQRLDANAFCQLSVELDYFETVLHPFSSPALEEILFQLREMLLQRTLQTLQQEAARPANARARADSEDRDGLPQTAADLKVMADDISSGLLPYELRRTKVNVFCFTGKVQIDPPPEEPQVVEVLPARPAAPPAVYTPNSAPPPSVNTPRGNPGNLNRTFSGSSSGSSAVYSQQSGSSARRQSNLSADRQGATGRGRGEEGYPPRTGARGTGEVPSGREGRARRAGSGSRASSQAY